MKIIHNQEPIASLFKKFDPSVVDNLLRVLVHTSVVSHEFFIKGELKDVYFSCDLAEKIRTEIACWIHACKQALERKDDDVPMLRSLSPALHDIYKSQDIEHAERVFARTYRMLLILEALLLYDEAEYTLAIADSNPYVHALNKLKNNSDINDSIMALLGNIKTKNAKLWLGSDSDWEVCLPLLLIVAVAESHCEYRQPFAWEAFSAGRSRDELRRRWGIIDPNFLNSCAVLIRYQSEVGQLGRGSGSSKFIKRITQEKGNLAFDTKVLLDALKLLSLVEEARNTPIPEIAGIILNSDTIFNAGSGSHMPWRTSTWDDDKFLKHAIKYLALDLYSITESPRKVTMSYFRHSYAGVDGPEYMDNLEQLLDDECQRVFKKNLFSYGQVSLGRLQTQSPLREMLGSILKKIDKSTFNQYFYLQELKVQSVFPASSEPEYILQVFMKTHLVAEKLLFPNRDPLENYRSDLCAQKPYDLFKHLMGVSEIEMRLAEDRAGSRLASDLYVPYPLIYRITNIIHRLMPELCLNIPITIDYKDSAWIHLPSGVPKDDEQSQLILANLILSTLLNRAMSSGLSHGVVDLQNLTILNPIKPTDITASEVMNPDDWRKYVKKLYQAGGFDVLLGPYMRAYNTSGDTISFDVMLSSDAGLNFANEGINAVAVGSVEDDLSTYLPSLNIFSEYGNNPPHSVLWLLGIDIGGTLTKFQFFKFTTNSDGIQPECEVFRMSTVDSNTDYKDFEQKSLQDKINVKTKDFVRRLLKTISERSAETVNKIRGAKFVVGLSWPGPVHDNRVAGTSGLVENFALTKDIQKNRIEDLWLIDLANLFKVSWNDMFKASPASFVTLLNDGDAEAANALLKAIKSGSYLQGSDGLAVIKLGTGLAGGFISRTKDRKLSMISGLFEWGKINLDCAAQPRHGFPQGVASEYLSKRSLPRLAKMRGIDKFFQQNEPDSLELSRIIELSMATKKSDVTPHYRDLLIDCGTIQAEKTPPYGIKISAEVLRLVYNAMIKEGEEDTEIDYLAEIDPDLLYQVRIALKKLDIAKYLTAELKQFGRIRIQRLIGAAYTAEKDTNEAKLLSNDPRFIEGANISMQCAQTLGRYLADFCVLLYDQLKVKDMILTGGVLSNDGAGKLAKEEAIKRAKQYGFILKPVQGEKGEIYRISSQNLDAAPKDSGQDNPEYPPHKRGSLKIEGGAYGAACFSAASFLQATQQKGFQHIRQVLLTQPTGTKIAFDNDVLNIASSQDSIEFPQYALSKKDIKAFLRNYGSKWGYFESDGETFIRWEPGE